MLHFCTIFSLDMKALPVTISWLWSSFNIILVFFHVCLTLTAVIGKIIIQCETFTIYLFKALLLKGKHRQTDGHEYSIVAVDKPQL